jgi:hypothetical protein
VEDPPDIERRPENIEDQKFGAPEGPLHVEEPVLPFKADFTMNLVQGRAPVLVHKIIGFAIPGKMDGMPLLLEVMAEMKAAGGMTKAFAADHKEDLHVVCLNFCCDA